MFENREKIFSLNIGKFRFIIFENLYNLKSNHQIWILVFKVHTSAWKPWKYLDLLYVNRALKKYFILSNTEFLKLIYFVSHE